MSVNLKVKVLLVIKNEKWIREVQGNCNNVKKTFFEQGNTVMDYPSLRSPVEFKTSLGGHLMLPQRLWKISAYDRSHGRKIMMVCFNQ